jgi:hypothetical protein
MKKTTKGLIYKKYNQNLTGIFMKRFSLLVAFLFIILQLKIVTCYQKETDTLSFTTDDGFSNDNTMGINSVSVTQGKGKVFSAIQMTSKTKLQLKVNTFINYFKELSFIQIKEEQIKKIKENSRINNETPQHPDTSDKMFAYYDRSKNELEITEEENLEQKANLIATGVYDRSRFQTGWDKLNIKTFSGANPLIQCWIAGYMEGVLSSDEIWHYYSNIHVFFKHKKNLITELKNFYASIDAKLKLAINTEAFEKLKDLENENETQHWAYITCLNAQIDGLHKGYNTMADEHKQLTVPDFYFINSEGNFNDLKTFLEINKMDIKPNTKFYTSENLKGVYGTDNIESIWKKLLRKGHCSALVKLVTQKDGTYDMLAGHNTWSEYCEMMRTLKLMEWAFEGENQVLGMKPRTINYSSYPGVLFSGDDFYEIDSKLVILQTTLSTLNKFLYKNVIDINKYIPEFMRIMITNFISETGLDWVNNYKSYHNHLYITQWIVLDYKVLDQINKEKLSEKNFLKKTNTKGLAYLIEEIPGSILYKDVSDILFEDTYFGSFNLSYFKKHQQILGLKDFGKIDFTSKSYNPRYYILNKLQNHVHDLNDFSHLIQYNGFHNKHADFPNDPSFTDPSSGISARNDVTGNYFEGGIDFKCVNKELVEKNSLYVYGGPTYDANPNLKPFDFNKLKGTSSDKYHNGIPSLWNFKPFIYSKKDFEKD